MSGDLFAGSHRHPFVSRGEAPPLAIARSEGPWIATPDGRRSRDAVGGAIVANIGYGRPPFAVTPEEVDRVVGVLEQESDAATSRAPA